LLAQLQLSGSDRSCTLCVEILFMCSTGSATITGKRRIRQTRFTGPQQARHRKNSRIVKHHVVHWFGAKHPWPWKYLAPSVPPRHGWLGYEITPDLGSGWLAAALRPPYSSWKYLDVHICQALHELRPNRRPQVNDGTTFRQVNNW